MEHGTEGDMVGKARKKRRVLESSRQKTKSTRRKTEGFLSVVRGQLRTKHRAKGIE
jgi:hypothetical protein